MISVPIRRDFAISLCTGKLLALAWLLPGSGESAVFAWLSAIGFAYLVQRTHRPMWLCFSAGCVAITLAFHWLAFTISYFGFMPMAAAVPVYFLFVAGHSLQFAVFGWLARTLYRRERATRGIPRGLAVALAWTAAETIRIEIFPWHLGHTQIAWESLTQVAALTGATGISFLMMWCAGAFVPVRDTRWRSRPTPSQGVPFSILAAVCCAGLAAGNPVTPSDASNSAPLTVVLVQPNLSMEEKGDSKLVRRNLELHMQLSRAAMTPNSLIIWPETAILEWLDTRTRSVRQDRRLPFFDDGAATLFGILSFSGQNPDGTERTHNSAVGAQPDGTLLPPYHKRILMPFGEFTPFADWFPWLRDINHTAADFTRGTGPGVMTFTLRDGPVTRTAAVAPLICYEDLVPALGREAARAGAQLLVNLTNDAWFGPSVAARQHHLIASFRAVETSRYLVRVTNSGHTAVVNPRGKTTSQLPDREQGSLVENVFLLDYKTPYTRFDIDWVWMLLALATFAGGVLESVRARVRSAASGGAGH